MLFYSVAILAWVATSLGTPPPGYVKNPDNDKDPPAYEYKYDIEDADGKGHGKAETRAGEFASGRYYVNTDQAASDVKYFADEWGYHPLVKYGFSDKHSSTTAQFALGEQAVKALRSGGDVGHSVELPGSSKKVRPLQVIQPYTLRLTETPASTTSSITVQPYNGEVDEDPLSSNSVSSGHDQGTEDRRGPTTVTAASRQPQPTTPRPAILVDRPTTPRSSSFVQLEEVRDVYANNDYENAALLDEQLFLQSAGNFGDKVKTPYPGSPGLESQVYVDGTYGTTPLPPASTLAYSSTKNNGDVSRIVLSESNANDDYSSAARNNEKLKLLRGKFHHYQSASESPVAVKYSDSSRSNGVGTGLLYASTTLTPEIRQEEVVGNDVSEGSELPSFSEGSSAGGDATTRDYSRFGGANPVAINYGLAPIEEQSRTSPEEFGPTGVNVNYGSEAGYASDKNQESEIVRFSAVSSNLAAKTGTFSMPIVVAETGEHYDNHADGGNADYKCTDHELVSSTSSPIYTSSPLPSTSTNEGILDTSKSRDRSHVTTTSVVLNPIQAGVSLVNAGATHLITDGTATSPVPVGEDTSNYSQAPSRYEAQRGSASIQSVAAASLDSVTSNYDSLHGERQRINIEHAIRQLQQQHEEQLQRDQQVRAEEKLQQVQLQREKQDRAEEDVELARLRGEPEREQIQQTQDLQRVQEAEHLYEQERLEQALHRQGQAEYAHRQEQARQETRHTNEQERENQIRGSYQRVQEERVWHSQQQLDGNQQSQYQEVQLQQALPVDQQEQIPQQYHHHQQELVRQLDEPPQEEEASRLRADAQLPNAYQDERLQRIQEERQQEEISSAQQVLLAQQREQQERYHEQQSLKEEQLRQIHQLVENVQRQQVDSQRTLEEGQIQQVHREGLVEQETEVKQVPQLYSNERVSEVHQAIQFQQLPQIHPEEQSRGSYQVEQTERVAMIYPEKQVLEVQREVQVHTAPRTYPTAQVGEVRQTIHLQPVSKIYPGGRIPDENEHEEIQLQQIHQIYTEGQAAEGHPAIQLQAVQGILSEGQVHEVQQEARYDQASREHSEQIFEEHRNSALRPQQPPNVQGEQVSGFGQLFVHQAQLQRATDIVPARQNPLKQQLLLQDAQLQKVASQLYREEQTANVTDVEETRDRQYQVKEVDQELRQYDVVEPDQENRVQDSHQQKLLDREQLQRQIDLIRHQIVENQQHRVNLMRNQAEEHQQRKEHVAEEHRIVIGDQQLRQRETIEQQPYGPPYVQSANQAREEGQIQQVERLQVEVHREELRLQELRKERDRQRSEHEARLHRIQEQNQKEYLPPPTDTDRQVAYNDVSSVGPSSGDGVEFQKSVELYQAAPAEEIHYPAEVSAQGQPLRIDSHSSSYSSTFSAAGQRAQQVFASGHKAGVKQAHGDLAGSNAFSRQASINGGLLQHSFQVNHGTSLGGNNIIHEQQRVREHHSQSHSHSDFQSQENDRGQQQVPITPIPYTLEASKELILPGIQGGISQIIKNPVPERHRGEHAFGVEDGTSAGNVQRYSHAASSSTVAQSYKIDDKQISSTRPISQDLVAPTSYRPLDTLIEKTIRVPQPYPVKVTTIVEKPIDRVVEKKVEVRVPQPYPVHVRVPVERVVEKTVHVPQPYPVEKIIEKKVPYPVDRVVEKHVPVPHPYPVPVERIVEKKVPYPVEKLVPQPYPVHIAIPQPFPVERIVERKVPYAVETIVEKPVRINVPVEKVVERIVEKPVHVPHPYPVEVEKIVEKKVPYPVEVTKYVEKSVPIRVAQSSYSTEKIVETPVRIRPPYPVEVSGNLPYGVRYGVSYQQIMKPHAQSVYAGQPETPFYGLPAFHRHQDFRQTHEESSRHFHGYSYEKPAIVFAEGVNNHITDQIASGDHVHHQLAHSSQQSLPKKSISANYSFPFREKTSSSSSSASSSSSQPNNLYSLFAHRRHSTRLVNANDKSRSDEYIGPVPPPRLSARSVQQHQQQLSQHPQTTTQLQNQHQQQFQQPRQQRLERPQEHGSKQAHSGQQGRGYQSSTSTTHLPSPTTTSKKSREAETYGSQPNTGAFRQSKVEYGFKPPMIPSVQYDEKTASKVES